MIHILSAGVGTSNKAGSELVGQFVMPLILPVLKLALIGSPSHSSTLRFFPPGALSILLQHAVRNLVDFFIPSEPLF